MAPCTSDLTPQLRSRARPGRARLDFTSFHSISLSGLWTHSSNVDRRVAKEEEHASATPSTVYRKRTRTVPYSTVDTADHGDGMSNFDLVWVYT